MDESGDIGRRQACEADEMVGSTHVLMMASLRARTRKGASAVIIRLLRERM